MKNKNIKVSYLIAIFSVILVLAISLVISKDKGQIENVKTPDVVIEEEGGIPSVKTFDKLYNLFKLNSKKEISEEENVIEENNIVQENLIATDENITENIITQNTVEEKVEEEAVVQEPQKEFEKKEGDYTYYVLENMFYIATQGKNSLRTSSKIDFSNTEEEEIKINETYIKENKAIIIYTKKVLNQTDDARNIFTVAEIYNTKNKRKPRLEREIRVEGEYLSSKNIENNLYVLSNKTLNLENYYGLAIENIDENDFKTMYNDTNFEEEKYLDFENMYYFDEENYTNYLNILGIDLNNEQETFLNTYLGAGDELYLLDSGFYIVKTIYDYKDTAIYGYYNNLKINSYIYKFIYEQNKINYYKIRNLQGDVFEEINEFNNTIRIVTEDSTTWESLTKTNDLYILNSELEIIGTLINFAENETLSKIEFIENTLNIETSSNEIKHYKIDLTETENINIILE